jgi:hypothetical protein
MPGGCIPFLRSMERPILGPAPPPVGRCGLFSSLMVVGGPCRGLDLGEGGRPLLVCRSQGLGTGMGSCVRLTSSREGWDELTSASPRHFFPAPSLLGWLIFWEIPLALGIGGVPPSGRLRSQGQEEPLSSASLGSVGWG